MSLNFSVWNAAVSALLKDRFESQVGVVGETPSAHTCKASLPPGLFMTSWLELTEKEPRESLTPDWEPQRGLWRRRGLAGEAGSACSLTIPGVLTRHVLGIGFCLSEWMCWLVVLGEPEAQPKWSGPCLSSCQGILIPCNHCLLVRILSLTPEQEDLFEIEYPE